MQGYAKNIQEGKEIKKVWGLGNIHVAHKKETASVLKAARRDHLNGNLQTSLEKKNTKPFTRTSMLKKMLILVFPL